MEHVQDATPLSQMSIPGTHDSAARYGGIFTQTQNLTITQQLELGIRFLDIRPKYVSDDDPTMFFPIHHGPVYQEILFHQVVDECITFLAGHNQECVIMNVQQEDSSVPGSDYLHKFQELMDNRIGYWHFPSTVPTLQDCRGRIVLIRPWDASDPSHRVGWPGGGLDPQNPQNTGLAWNGFNISGTSSNDVFVTQNGWKSWDGDEKGGKVEEYLMLAYGDPGASKIYFNWLSSARTGGNSIGKFSENMNQRIRTSIGLDCTDRSKTLGILPMDFCGNTGPSGDCLETDIIARNHFKAP